MISKISDEQTISLRATPISTKIGSKYVPPHLRNRGGGASSGGGNKSFKNENTQSSGRVGYGNRGGDGGYGGGDRRSGGYGGERKYDNGPAPVPSTGNSRWNNIDMDNSESGSGSYRGGGGRYQGGRGGGYGGGYGGGRRGPRVNERGFHGDMRPDPRLEKQLFGREDVQTTGINFDNYDDIPVETTGNDIPEPIDTYSIETIGEELMRNTQLCGYHKPTPVQKYSVPIGTAGRDLMACAQTGSG